MQKIIHVLSCCNYQTANKLFFNKRISVMAVLFAFLLFSPLRVAADVFMFDGIYYETKDETSVKVVKTQGAPYAGDIVIPETVQNGENIYTVTEIASEAFFRSSITSIVLPDCISKLGSKAFRQTPTLKSVVLSNSIETIDIYTFDKCTSLTSITIPGSVTTIKNSTVFGGCTGLASLTFSKGSENLTLPVDAFKNAPIKSLSLSRNLTGKPFAEKQTLEDVTIGSADVVIGDSAFWNCPMLKSIIVPGDVAAFTSISKSAFVDCNALKELIVSDGADEFTLPDAFGGFQFESLYMGRNISGNPFVNSTSLKSVTIGSGINTVGAELFGGCTALETLGISGSVSEITITDDAFAGAALQNLIVGDGDGALKLNASQTVLSVDSLYLGRKVSDFSFANSPRLRTVTIGNGYDAIAPGMFRGCASLTSVVLPETITSIGGSAFNECTSLSSINLPDGITHIEGQAFRKCAGLVSLVLPSNLVSIGTEAFGECRNLKEVVMNDALEELGGYTFQYCDSLTSVIFGKGLKKTGDGTFMGSFKGNEPVSITIPGQFEELTGGYGLFKGCSGLSEVIFEEGSTFTTIPANTFYGCTSLSSVIVPSNVSTIDPNAFNEGGCQNLKKLTISDGESVLELPESLGTAPIESLYLGRTISGVSFSGSKTLASLVLSEVFTEIESEAYKGCSSLAEVTMSGVTSIGASAFEGCSALSSIDIASVTSIGTSAFSGCGLTAVVLNESVTSVPEGLFKNCVSLSEVIMPGVTSIGTSAFEGCSSLSVLDIAGVTSIGASAFGGTGLASVTLSEELTFIADNVFKNCAQLAEVTVPNAVTTIGASSYEGCSALTSLTLGSGLGEIGSTAFKGCSALESIVCQASVPPVCAADCFEDVDRESCALTVPEESVAAYRAAEVWKEFFDEESGVNEVIFGSMKIYRQENRIILDNVVPGEQISIYSVCGNLIQNTIADDYRTEIILPTGCMYIVKRGGEAEKVVL